MGQTSTLNWGRGAVWFKDLRGGRRCGVGFVGADEMGVMVVVMMARMWDTAVWKWKWVERMIDISEGKTRVME